jgi:probable F420-dependent oxidoreductase
MKFGLYGLHKGSSVESDTLARRARRAEAAGFESLWVGDHVALPADAPDVAGEPRLELVVVLAHLAALTSRVRLATGVAVLPTRQPVLLAKQLASIDVLSNGRLIVGVGVGYVEPELNALGASVADRGARTDEYLAAMRALWDEPTPSFNGAFVSFSGIIERPRPVQRPHPPIICGGHSRAAYRRAMTAANGWYGWQLDPDETVAALTSLRDAADEYGRPVELGELEISITPPYAFDVDMARRYADVGVHRLVVQPPTSSGSAMDDLIDELESHFIGKI